MKYCLSTSLLLPSLVVSQVFSGGGSNGVSVVNGKTCNGSVWNNVCCIGNLNGPAVDALQSSLNGLGDSIQGQVSSQIAAQQSALSAQFADPTFPDKKARAPMPTPPPTNYLIRRAMTEISSGVTCFGSAISLDASDYSAQVASATAAMARDAQAFTAGGSSASGGSSVLSSGGSSVSTGGSSVSTGGSSITSVGGSTANGGSPSPTPTSATSTSSRAGAAFITQAPGLLVGGAAVVMAYGVM